MSGEGVSMFKLYFKKGLQFFFKELNAPDLVPSLVSFGFFFLTSFIAECCLPSSSRMTRSTHFISVMPINLSERYHRGAARYF